MLHRFIPLFMLGIGVFVLVQVLMPLISFKIWETFVYSQQNITLVSPTSDSKSVLGVSVETRNNFPVITSNNKRATPASYETFNIAIPSIKLEGAEVFVDSNTFDNHLSHLPGSALPGEKGNVFISGHSSLPQFFRQDNYKAIFSKLPDIKKGDLIVVTAGGQKFEYIVKGLTIVNPMETWVINPPDEAGRYLTLMTCVPPGLNTKRLTVLAKLKGF
ncbi:MAG: class E sortase [Candidatus Daviesbacteria bacterium]|nr:class E sortase [Candidatus Daviesbacteria bacterium]